MRHPAIDELLRDTDETRAHVLACVSCRSLATLSGAALALSKTEDVVPLPIVDPSVYGGLEEIAEGRGAMGRTLRARDLRIGRVVVLKQLPAIAPSESTGERAAARRRFEHEAKLTARLDHPAIVGVHEVGRWPDGEPFYSMRFVDGVSLDLVIAERPDHGVLLEHAIVIADALAYSHERHIVHRDVKPANVLVGPFGETVVIDWGIAKDLDEAGDPLAPDGDARGGGLTALGVGTPQYMAPEQARGAGADVRMDVYGLGATLYHAFAGAPPYPDRPGESVRARLLAGPPPALSDVAPDVPLPLVAIVEKAMARDPADRFQTARELGLELRRYRDGELTRTYPHGLGDRLLHLARRHRVVVRATLASVVAIAVVLTLSFVRVARERDAKELARARAEKELDRSRGITATLLAHEPFRRLEALDLAVRSIAPRLLAGEPVEADAMKGMLDAMSAPVVLAIGEHGGVVRSLDVSQDGRRVVTLGNAGLLRAFDAASGEVLMSRAAGSLHPETVALSPSGTLALLRGGDELTVLRADASDGRDVANIPGKWAFAAFAGDDVVIAAGHALAAFSSRGAPVARLALAAPARALATSTDPVTAAVATLDGAVWLWRPEEATPRKILGGADVAALAFVARGSRLVATTFSGDTYDLDPRAPSGDAPRPRPTGARLGSELATSLSGRSLAVADLTERLRQAFVFVDRETGEATPFRDSILAGRPFVEDDALFVTDRFGHLVLRDRRGGERWKVLIGAAAIQSLRSWVSPGVDARVIGAGMQDDSLVIADARWNATTGVMMGHGQEVTAVLSDRAGKRLISASLDGSVLIWDAATGTAVERHDTGAPLVAASSPEGAAIAVAGTDGTVRVIDGGAARPPIRAGAPVASVALSGDGTKVALVSLDGEISLRGARSGETLWRAGPFAAATAVALSDDGDRVVSGHVDRHVRSWSVATGALAFDVLLGSESCRDGIARLFFTGPDRLVASLPCGETRVLDARSGTTLATFEGTPASDPSTAVRGDDVVLLSPDGHAVLSPLAGGPSRVVPFLGDRPVTLAAFSRGRAARLATIDTDGTVGVWDVSGAPRLEVTFDEAGELRDATTLALSPEGDTLYVGHVSGALRSYAVTPAGALDRACSTLRSFRRKGPAADQCESWKSRNATRDR